MLGKLIKYEMKSTSRVMWFIYAAIIICGTLIGIGLRFNISTGALTDDYTFDIPFFGLPQILLIVFMILYGVLLFAMAIMTIIMIIMRFNNNLLKGEGYLMHTLPVPTWMLVLSKMIIAIIWMAIGAVTAFLSAFLLGLTSGLLQYIIREDGLKKFLSDIMEVFGSNSGLLIISVIVGSIALILQFYFSMAVGNIANRNKFLLAVATFIGVQIVITIISSIVGDHVGTSLRQYGDFSVTVISDAFTNLLVRGVILNAIYGAAFFFGTTTILKKRLNLA